VTKVLIIDNYDSFVYNIAQYLGETGADIVVKRNNILLEEVKKAKPDKIVLSPGPGHPKDSRVALKILKTMSKRIPTLGVCLGHQAIAYIYGAKIVFANKLLHGKTSLIYHKSNEIFKGIPNPISATRYHSLIVSSENFPDCLEIIAKTILGEIMGIKHKQYPIYGVQFHPESILTQQGKYILKNFLEGCE